MSESEQLIWVDQDNNVLGAIERRLVHNPGDLKLHREAMGFLWTDSNRDSFWLQRRSKSKEQYPGMLTLAATCHVLWSDMNDEDKLGYVTAIEREAKEEIKVRAKNLKLVGVVEMKTVKNRTMSGVVEGIADGRPEPDGDEVEEVLLFDRGSIQKVVGELTPNARRSLIILGILSDIPEEEVK